MSQVNNRGKSIETLRSYDADDDADVDVMVLERAQFLLQYYVCFTIKMLIRKIEIMAWHGMA